MMMDNTFQTLVKNAVRGQFGSAEIRFYNDSVTVTLREQFGQRTINELGGEVEDLLLKVDLSDELSVEMVTANRFKLNVKPLLGKTDPEEDASHPQWDQPSDYTHEAEDIQAVASEALDLAVLQDMQKKEVEREVEDFIATNLGAAMAILKRSRTTISLDETKELMRFSYISGLWANAREKDIEVLVRVFNEKFASYSNEWNLQTNDTGNG